MCTAFMLFTNPSTHQSTNQPTNTNQRYQVTEVERLLKESKDAPFQMREHYLLSDKFKIIIKRRRVAASIDGRRRGRGGVGRIDLTLT